MNYEVICSECGKPFKTYRAWAKRTAHHHCSPACHSAWKSKAYSGSGNPRYTDGHSLIARDPEFYGWPVESDPYFLAWLAGLVDGEGSFVLGCGIKKLHHIFAFAPTVVVKMHERETPHLDYIHQALGFGRRYQMDKSGCCSWQTTKKWEAFKLCCLLWPYLRIKKRQSEILLQACLAIDGFSSTGGYNGNADRLWYLLQLRDGLNPGTYRNRHRVEFTREQVDIIVANQNFNGLVVRNKPSRITDDLLDLLPQELSRLRTNRCSLSL